MKKVVIFGGGSGLSNILRSLKTSDINLKVFVTVSDNGGSTGKIRKYYNIPAPGDLRRVVLALSDDEKIEEIMNYRFDDNIDNHTIGNLVLAAMADVEKNMESAVRRYCQMLGVNRDVYPISNENVTLSAILNNDEVVHGEKEMVKNKNKIEKIFYEKTYKATDNAINAVRGADFIIFSSGSLYTSVLSNVVYENLILEIKNATAKKIYVANMMTEKGETDNYQLSDHIDTFKKHFNSNILDYVIANNNYLLDSEIMKNYEEEEAKMVKIDEKNINNITLIQNDYVEISEKNYVRHNVNQITKDLDLVFKGEI